MARKSCSTYRRFSAAPPKITGGFRPRSFMVMRSSFMMTVDFTSSPDMPMASALVFCNSAIMFSTGCLMPRLYTL